KTLLGCPSILFLLYSRKLRKCDGGFVLSFVWLQFFYSKDNITITEGWYFGGGGGENLILLTHRFKRIRLLNYFFFRPSPFRKYSKNKYACSLASGFGECLGRFVIATRLLYPKSLLTSIV